MVPSVICAGASAGSYADTEGIRYNIVFVLSTTVLNNKIARPSPLTPHQSSARRPLDLRQFSLRLARGVRFRLDQGLRLHC